MQFIVMQQPKISRIGLIGCVVVVEAKSKAEALRLTHAHFSREGDFYKPRVEILEINHLYMI